MYLWKTKVVKELINIREGFINVENFEDDDLNEVLEYLFSSYMCSASFLLFLLFHSFLGVLLFCNTDWSFPNIVM